MSSLTRRERRLLEEKQRAGRHAAELPEPESEEELKKLIEEEQLRVSKSSGRRRAKVSETDNNEDNEKNENLSKELQNFQKLSQLQKTSRKVPEFEKLHEDFVNKGHGRRRGTGPVEDQEKAENEWIQDSAEKKHSHRLDTSDDLPDDDEVSEIDFISEEPVIDTPTEKISKIEKDLPEASDSRSDNENEDRRESTEKSSNSYEYEKAFPVPGSSLDRNLRRAAQKRESYKTSETDLSDQKSSESSENLKNKKTSKIFKKREREDRENRAEENQPYERLREILSRIGKWILIPIVAIIGIAFFANFILGLSFKPVVSNSMVPTLTKGDLIITSDRYNSIGVGDIVTYKAAWLQDKTVVHRIVDVNGNNIVTQGDNNKVSDPEFNADRVTGEVVSSVPKVGYIFNSKTIIALGVPAAILYALSDRIFDGPFRRLKKFREERKQN